MGFVKPLQVMNLALIAVLAAAGLCLFHTDHAAQGDLCLFLLAAATIAMSLAFSLPLTGRFEPALTAAYRLVLQDLPAPPPKA